jgi:uncharacterized ubiquitin-like protein YukD
LHWVNQRVTLKDQDTLPDAGVGTGDQLKLVSSTPNIAVEEEGGIQTGVGDADKTVDVVLSVLDLNKGTVETLQLDTKVGDLIKEITSKNELPKVDKLNVPIIYRMSSKAKGQILLESDTLRKARVPRHDRLSIVREDIPGGELS